MGIDVGGVGGGPAIRIQRGRGFDFQREPSGFVVAKPVST